MRLVIGSSSPEQVVSEDQVEGEKCKCESVFFVVSQYRKTVNFACIVVTSFGLVGLVIGMKYS